MTEWQEFHFLRWYWLFALIVPVMGMWLAVKYDHVQSAWAKVCDENLLNFLLIKNQNKQRRFPFFLAGIILALGIISIAGPTWQKKQNPALSVENPIMILLNMSSDMLVKDAAPNRLIRAKYVVKDLLQAFHNTESGLMVYSREPFIVTPLTEDNALIDNLLDAVESDIMPENGDRLDRAIDLAVDRMKSAGYPKGNIIVLTADVGERFDAAMESAAKAQADGIDVHIIKVSGTDNEKLNMVADKGNGLFLNYKDSYQPLVSRINDIADKELKQSKNLQSVWQDMGYFLFWLPALLMLYYFRRGLLMILFLMLTMQQAQAGWFLNRNQEGMRYFEQQQYDKAAESFDNIQWRGAAAYKNGNYEQALRDFSQSSDITSLYNQGNALAKSGKIDEAIAKYEEVLRQDEHFEDARFNLEYLKKQKQQEQNQQDKKENQSQNQKNDKNEQQQNQQQKQQEQQDQQSQQQEQQQNQQQEQQENQEQQEQREKQKQQEQQNQKQDQSDSSSAQQQNNQQGENSAQQENQEQNSEQQNSSGDKNSQNSDTSSESSKDKTDKRQQQQQIASENQQQTGEDEAVETMQKAHLGSEDEQADNTANAVEVQAGEQSDEEKEKIRARLQKFREIKEDKGGLLRAFIRKEYEKNRYKNN